MNLWKYLDTISLAFNTCEAIEETRKGFYFFFPHSDITSQISIASPKLDPELGHLCFIILLCNNFANTKLLTVPDSSVFLFQ